jgi:hypothetical protein
MTLEEIECSDARCNAAAGQMRSLCLDSELPGTVLHRVTAIMRELAELRGYFAALADVARADDLKVKPRRDYRRDAKAKLEAAR